ncbi:NACHT, LRR and PYD domains-containing protein 1a-like [Myripristis murdjan]|uniref:NACHT, LRR and PYD domains-containing protein 1a-like n=1 Tax=Myripristis murdjan TaxID=586833 RepID=UPI001175F732|nr:caspase recruitment domain-containing protein 8 [Myripristis murdjan]
MDSTDWIKVKPEVIKTDGVLTYRLQSTAGGFECSVSALRWVCDNNVSFQYQFGSWDRHMERLAAYRPAGPLLDIKVISGKLREVYLPHWICLDHSPDVSESFAVLHVHSDGVSVERGSEVTQCHIKLFETDFSPRGVLMKIGIKVKMRCNVLIYKTNNKHVKLHVYLIPRDAAVLQAMEQMEKDDGYRRIKKPNPNKCFQMQDYFILTTDMATAEIIPRVTPVSPVSVPRIGMRRLTDLDRACATWQLQAGVPAETVDVFKRRLKTHLFNLAFI